MTCTSEFCPEEVLFLNLVYFKFIDLCRNWTEWEVKDLSAEWNNMQL